MCTSRNGGEYGGELSQHNWTQSILIWSGPFFVLENHDGNWTLNAPLSCRSAQLKIITVESLESENRSEGWRFLYPFLSRSWDWGQNNRKWLQNDWAQLKHLKRTNFLPNLELKLGRQVQDERRIWWWRIKDCSATRVLNRYAVSTISIVVMDDEQR